MHEISLLSLFFYLKDMNTRRVNSTRREYKYVNEGVPPQHPQDLQVPQNPIHKGVITNVEIRSDLQILTQAMMIKVNMITRTYVNPNINTSLSRMKEFTRMNPP